MDQKTSNYLNAMSLVNDLVNQGLVTKSEYFRIEEKLAKKYCINKKGIYRLNDLINTPFRASNMNEQKKEVKEENGSPKVRIVTNPR